MDGENNGKPLLKWDDLGGKTISTMLGFPPHMIFIETSEASRPNFSTDLISLD